MKLDLRLLENQRYLISAIGIPSSGKTTALRKLQKELNTDWFSFDENLKNKFSQKEIEELSFEKAQNLVFNELEKYLNNSSKQIVIYDGMNLRKKDRQIIRLFAKKDNRETLFIYFDVSPEVAIQRNNLNQNKHIPTMNIVDAGDRLENPDGEEDIVSFQAH